MLGRLVPAALLTVLLATLPPAQCEVGTLPWSAMDAMALDDGTLVVAAVSEEVHVYEETPLGWVQVDTLTASDGGEGFGGGVAIDGDRIAIGAPRVDLSEIGGVFIDNGAVYVFERGPGGWQETAILNGDENLFNGQFGTVLALDGDRLAIGDPEFQHNYVNLYEFDGVDWVFQQQLTDPDGSPSFPGRVLFDGSDLLVSAWTAGIQGAIRVFTDDGTAWNHTADIRGNDVSGIDWFGASMDLDGNTLVVGAPRDSEWGTFSGSVYVFERQGAAWVQTEEIWPFAPAPAPSNQFGTAVVLDGNLLLASLPFYDVGPGGDEGAVFHYEYDGVSWNQMNLFWAANPVPNERFGRELLLEGDFAVATTFVFPSGPGATHFLSMSDAALLGADVPTISAGAGGSQVLSVSTCPPATGEFSLVLGSFSGVSPGTPYGGVVVPLVNDPYLFLTLSQPNSFITGSFAALDGSGANTATLNVPPGLALAGLTAHHAAVILNLADLANPGVTPAVPVAFLP